MNNVALYLALGFRQLKCILFAVVRNIIFDWSGTLVDDLPAVWKATNHVFQMAGIETLTLEKFRAEFCLPFANFYQRYTPHVEWVQLETWFHGHFKEVQHEVVELPHAREFLRACRQRKIRTFLLSTVHRNHFAAQSETTGFGELIDHPYVEILDKRMKIGEILREHGLDPAETLFVGDMQHDIETAHHGGVYACAVLTGYNSLEQLRASHPDLIVEHLGELQSVLDRRNWDLSDVRPESKLPISTVGAAIFNAQRQVLMIRTRKWSNLWGIPGGKIKFGESSIDALRREILEETALAIKDIEFVLVQDCIHSVEFYRDAHFILLNYVCLCDGPEQVTLNDEAEEFRWLPIGEAFQLPLNKPTELLLKALVDGFLPWTKSY